MIMQDHVFLPRHIFSMNREFIIQKRCEIENVIRFEKLTEREAKPKTRSHNEIHAFIFDQHTISNRAFSSRDNTFDFFDVFFCPAYWSYRNLLYTIREISLIRSLMSKRLQVVCRNCNFCEISST